MEIVYIPFFIQGAVMIVDEFYFHHRRTMPRWERIGHPLDTMTVLACIGMTIYFPFTPTMGKIYIFLAIFSCLFVTKDEWIHYKHCHPFEQWLHALQFLIHPIVFISAGFLWASGVGELFRMNLFFVMLFFLAYQILYWNIGPVLSKAFVMSRKRKTR